MADWQQLLDIPGINNAGIGAWENKIYIIGGTTQTTYIYDTISKNITMGTEPPFKYGCKCVAHNGKISCLAFDNNLYETVYIYNISTNSWQISVSFQDYWDLGFAAYKDTIYIVGGYAESTVRDQILFINTANPQYYNTLSARLPEGRAYSQCLCYNGYLYVIGGMTAINRWYPSSSVFILNLSNMTWEKGSSAPTTELWYKQPSIYNSEIYCLPSGGNKIQVYNISNDTWRFFSNPFFLTDGDFSGTGYYGRSGTKLFRFEMSTANISNALPSSGFVNEKIANTFSWTLESNPAGTAQLSAIFQWRIRGASTVNTINVGTTQSVTVPSDTLPQGEFEWRVSATNAAGIEAPFTEWFLLTTIDPKPNKPTGLYPNTGSRDGTKTIQFSWLHNSILSTPQSAFEIQVTYDGGTTWKALSNKVTTVVTQFTAAANTIFPTDPTGRIGWRVRTYNSDDVVSDWSDTAFFIVHPAPQTPNWVSVETGRSRPLCRWTSLMQVGFQLQVLLGESVVFDSGEIHGTQTEYRIPQFLNNGVYNFRIRIKNIRGLYSAWANRSVSINARHSLNITLRGEPIEGGAALDFDVEVRA